MNNNLKKLKLRIITIFAVVLGVVYVMFSDFSEDEFSVAESVKSESVSKGIAISNFDLAADEDVDRPVTETSVEEVYKETVTDSSDIISDKININTATEDLLTTLPSIGNVIAKSIIEYRETNGPFTDIEQIKNVKRIGDKTFEKIKNKIKVG